MIHLERKGGMSGWNDVDRTLWNVAWGQEAEDGLLWNSSMDEYYMLPPILIVNNPNLYWISGYINLNIHPELQCCDGISEQSIQGTT